jgi:predicted nucleic acid-binding protein
MSIVIEASAVVDYLLDPQPPRALRDVISDETLYAPHLIDFEIASAIRGLLLASKISVTHASRALANFASLTIERVPMTGALRHVLNLRDNFTAYDASYVVLARSLNLPLQTSDAKFKEARKLGVEVRVAGEA